MDNETALMPSNLDAERRLCGSLILDPKCITDTMGKIVPEHFYYIPTRYVYEAMCRLQLEGSPISPETVANSLNEKKDLDGKSKLEIVGGAVSLMDMLEGAMPDEAEYWQGVVVKKYEERKLLEFGNEVRRLALSSPDDIGKLRSKLEEKLVTLSGGQQSSSISIGVAINELEQRIQRYIDNPDDIVGMSTGFCRLDDALDGLQPGNVSIIYAPSSRFKSLFATNIGWHLSEQNIPGLWFTTEMPRVQVLERVLQLESGLNLKWLRRDKRVYEHRKRISDSQHRISQYPIFFCDTSALEVSEVRMEVSRHKRWNDIRYIIVDLVDHISSSRYKDEMVNNQRMVMASMKQIAKDCDVHVILVSHVGKGNEQTRKQADLDVEEMIGSAAKYQDVDASISIAPVKYDEYMNFVAMNRSDIINAMAGTGHLDVMISVTKNRHGQLDRYLVDLDFNKGGRMTETLFRPIADVQEGLTFVD